MSEPSDLAAARRALQERGGLGNAAGTAMLAALKRLHADARSSEALRELAVATFAGLIKRRDHRAWMSLEDFLRNIAFCEDFDTRVSRFITEASKHGEPNP